jgi:hypothetical protein
MVPATEPNSLAALANVLEGRGAPAAFDKLAEILRSEKKLPQLFEALLMKKRHELGLPLLGTDTFRDLPEATQRQVEDYYIEVCREIGGLYLEQGDISGAWPYFRAIDEPKKIAEAIDAWQPPVAGEASETYETAGSKTDAIVDIALHQGANPRRGYELVLSQYGVCRAITVLEHQFPHAGDVKEECGGMLVRRLHRDLVESLRNDIRHREGAVPAESDVRVLIENRPWLFQDHGYHVDVSHLQSVIRASASFKNKDALELALQMTEYGRRLPRDFQMNDRPPFDDFYNDYRIFLQAIAGTGIDGAVRYFTQKADRASPDEDGKHFPGEVLVHLLYRVGRYKDAIEAHLKYLGSYRGPLSAAPTLFELCELAGDYSKVLEQAKSREDLLQYTAALVKQAGVRTAD